MDQIHLKPMRLTRKAYFRVMVLLKVRKDGWLYVALIAMGLFLLVTVKDDHMQFFIALVAFAWPLFVLVWFYAWAHRKDNVRMYEERIFVLYPDKLVGTTPGGGRSELPWSYMQRVVEVDGRILLYISAGQMVILDRSSFPDRDAEQRFRQWLAAGMKK